MINKKNDWVATIMFQPNATLEDFYANDISPDNTTIQSPEYYKNIPQVQEQFKNENGEFDETKFNDFYDQSLQLYNVFAQTDYNNKILDTFEYDPWDAASGWNREKKDMSSSIQLAPLGSQFETESIHSLGLIRPSDWSLEEIAQTQKVVDPETGEELDWTPNEKGGLFKSLLRPSIVYATWDEDGTHEFNGRVFEHKKGDWKLNLNGLPHTELAGNRELYDKTFVGIPDTITKEGSKLNKYDFFDSDGLDKSVGGTIAKTVVSIAPYFIPGVNTAFGAVSASLMLAELLPTFVKGVTGIIRGDDDSEFERTLNRLENYTARFRGDVSDASKQSLATFENFGNLIKDVSSQLFQQQVVGIIPKLFTKNNASARKIGSKLALGYMAATSGRDAYSQFKAAGADDTIAGLGMLGTMGGLYWLMNQNYFRDFAAKGSFWDDSIVKDATRSTVQDWRNNLFGKVTNKETATNFLQKVTQSFSKKGLEEFKEGAKRFATSNSFWQSAVNEGFEETAEEGIADIIKGLTAGLNALGFDITEENKTLDFGFSTKDFLQRYAMSFAGGFIGGPIFELHHRWDATLQKHLHGIMPKELSEEFVYLIRNKRTNEVLETLDNWHEKGQLADPNLSGKNKKTVKTADGKTEEVWAAAENGESQNDLIYNVLTSYVRALDTILSNEGLKLTDTDIKAVLNKNGEFIDDPLVNKALSRGLDTAILQDLNSLSDQIIKVHSDLDSKLKELSEGKPTSTVEEREAVARINKENPEVLELQSRLEELRAAKNSILSGERTKYYIGQGLFVLDDDTNHHFTNLTLDNYTKIKYNQKFSNLTEKQQNNVKAEHAEYMKTVGSQNLKKAYDYYLDFSQQHAEEINALNEVEGQITPGGYLEKTFGQKWIENGVQIALLNMELSGLNEEAPDYEEKKQSLTEQINTLQESNKKYVQYGLGTFILNELDPESEFKRLRDLEIVALQTPEIAQREIDITAQKLFDFYNSAGMLKTSNTFKIEANQFLKSAIAPLTEISYYTPVIRWAEEHREKLEEIGFDIDTFDNLTRLISAIETNVGKNNANAIALYNQYIEIKSGITQDLSDYIEDINEEDSGILLDLQQRLENANIVIAGKMLPDFLTEIDSFVETAAQSPIKTFFDQIAVQINGRTTNLIDMIENEERALISKRNIEDYVIESPIIEQEFEEASQLLHVVEALVNGGYSGLNHAINSVPGNTIVPLGEITEGASKVIGSYFNNIRQRLNVLQTIHNMNKNAALNVQKDIAIATNKNQIQFFANEFDALNLTEVLQLGDNWKSEVEAILNKYNVSLEQLDESNFNDLDQAKVEIESLLYERINFANISNKEEFVNKLIDLFGKDLWTLNAGTFTTQSNLTSYSKLIYLFSILSVDPKQFYAKYKKITMSEDFKFAPIAAQEFLIRAGYATYLNPTFAKIINHKIQQLVPDGKDYIKNRSILNNLFVILGGAGTGKTTCCDYVLSKMITEDRSKVYAVAPSETLVSKLAKDIDTENKLTRDQFLKYIYGETYSPKYEIDKNTKHVISDASYNFKSLTPGAIVVIDEITFYSEAELKAITDWAIAKGYFIIGSGDLKQNGLLVKGKNEEGNITTLSSGIEDTVFISGPELVTSLRADNQASFRNAMKMDMFLYDAWQEVRNNDLSVATGHKHVKDRVNSGLELVYTETNTGLYGEKLVNSKDAEAALDQIRLYPVQDGEEKTIVVIADDETAPKWQNKPGIILLRPEQVQGSDYTYAIIDLKNITNSDTNNNCFSALRNLYTLTQRSRRGTVIIDNGGHSWSEVLNLSTKEIVDGASPMRLTSESIENFKQFRNESLNKITTTEEVEVTPITFEASVSKVVSTPPPVTTVKKAPNPTSSTPESKPEPKPTGEEDAKSEDPQPVVKTTPAVNPTSPQEEIIRKEVKVDVNHKYSLNFGKGYFLSSLQSHPEWLKFTRVFGDLEEKQQKEWLLTISDLVFNSQNGLDSVKTKLIEWVKDGRISSTTEIAQMISTNDVVLNLRFNRQKDGAVLSLQLTSSTLGKNIKLPIGFSANNYLDGVVADFNISEKRGLKVQKTSAQQGGRQTLSEFEETTGTKFLDYVIFRDIHNATEEKQVEWAERNNGKAFGILTDDLTIDSSEIDDFLTAMDVDESFVNSHPSLTLVGIQRKNTFKTFIDYCVNFERARKTKNLTEFIKTYKDVFGEDVIIPFTSENLWSFSHKIFPLNIHNADRLLAKIVLQKWDKTNPINAILHPVNAADKTKFTFKLGNIELDFIFESDVKTGGVYRIINNPNFKQTFNTINEIAEIIKNLAEEEDFNNLQFSIKNLAKNGNWYSDRINTFYSMFTYDDLAMHKARFTINTGFVEEVIKKIPHSDEINMIDSVKEYISGENWLPISNFDAGSYSVLGQVTHSVKNISFTMTADSTTFEQTKRLNETITGINKNAVNVAQNVSQQTSNIDQAVAETNAFLEKHGHTEVITKNTEAVGDSEFVVKQKTLEEKANMQIKQSLARRHPKDSIKNWNLIASETSGDWKIGLVYVTLNDGSDAYYVYNSNGKTILTPTKAGEAFKNAWNAHAGENKNPDVLKFLRACLVSAKMTDEIVNKYLTSTNKNESLVNEFLKMQLENHEC